MLRLPHAQWPDPVHRAFAYLNPKVYIPLQEPSESGGDSTPVYFTCADCAIEAKQAAGSGGQVFRDKFSTRQYGFISLITDPDGNRIGLHSMK